MFMVFLLKIIRLLRLKDVYLIENAFRWKRKKSKKERNNNNNNQNKNKKNNKTIKKNGPFPIYLAHKFICPENDLKKTILSFDELFRMTNYKKI